MDYEIMMNGTIRIGQKAPSFEAVSTMGKVCLEDYKGKWLVLFSYPGDFMPVCTSEIIAFTKAKPYFDNLNTEILGISVDSNYSHLAWIYDIYCRTNIKVNFPIIADKSSEIARKYGMFANDASKNEPLRNVYIIDDKGIIRMIFVYPMNIGRSLPEILRSLQALKLAEENNALAPANWIPCEQMLSSPPNNFDRLLECNYDMKNGWYTNYIEAKSCSMIKENMENNRESEENVQKDNYINQVEVGINVEKIRTPRPKRRNEFGFR